MSAATDLLCFSQRRVQSSGQVSILIVYPSFIRQTLAMFQIPVEGQSGWPAFKLLLLLLQRDREVRWISFLLAGSWTDTLKVLLSTFHLWSSLISSGSQICWFSASGIRIRRKSDCTMSAVILQPVRCVMIVTVSVWKDPSWTKNLWQIRTIK